MQDVIEEIDGQVRVIFGRTSDQGLDFKDALWFSKEEYSNTTPEQVLQLQEERYTNWVNLINPPV